MADSGGGSGAYDERRVPLEDSDHLAVHCVHIFMQNLYHYATQNTVRTYAVCPYQPDNVHDSQSE